MATLSSPERRKHFAEAGHKYKAMKTAHGAHGGNVSYEQDEGSPDFEVHDYYTKDRKHPGDKTTPALNKAAEYNT